mmetsp:Transcript_27769/g.60720  ORF Transcript_27769/g.60720 Transcript_27769/m.60720 type:complete len:259 (-) Transcript_27769:301-1077(-)
MERCETVGFRGTSPPGNLCGMGLELRTSRRCWVLFVAVAVCCLLRRADVALGRGRQWRCTALPPLPTWLKAPELAQISKRHLLIGLLPLALPRESLAEDGLQRPLPPRLLTVTPYVDKVKRLREVTHESGELVNLISTQVKGGGLMGGGADALKERLERGKAEVLQPLLDELSAAALELAPGLEGPQRQRLQELPVLLKGHLLELTDAVDKRLFSQYSSKSTGKVYEGGRAERELEEVEETLQEFLQVAGQSNGPVGK